MRWHDERIAEEIDAVWCRDGELRGGNVRPLMVAMRDDYERALLGQRAEAVELAQEVAELERKLISATVTVQPGWCAQCNMPEEHCRESHGVLYAKGCAPE